MNLSRRGFLGGAVAALALRILPSPLAAREPRTWVWLDFQVNFDPRATRIVARWAACRSDGVCFTTGGPVYLEDISVPRGEFSPEVLAIKQQTRILLNGFLDSRCDCRPGYWCQLHNYMKPRNLEEYPTDKDGRPFNPELDPPEDADDMPTAIYEVITG